MSTNPPTTQELVAEVRRYALDHYEQGGWDYVVESYSDEEIEELIAGAQTRLGALRKVSAVVGLRASVRADIQGY